LLFGRAAPAADRAALASFDEDLMLDLFEQACDVVEPGIGNLRQRATYAIQRPREQRLLARVDGAGRRYENRSTLMTSNRPLEERGKLLQDAPTATAILDRFLHHAEVVTLKGRAID
jgi:hypothetical protein